MNYALNVNRLAILLENLHEITRLQISLHDTTGVELYAARSRSVFCDLICNSEEGYQRCLACDRRAASPDGPLFTPVQYRCHAGLIEAAIPITEGGQLVATILFGQILDDTSVEEQWSATRRQCAWYADLKALEEAFRRLPRLTRKQIRACYEIINACVSEIRLEGLLKANAQTDAQRLELYIGVNFAQPLTIASISQALSIGKSKLYQISGRIEPGLTISRMIARRRIAAARQLLARPGMTVRDAAERVGIPDYNYFSKVFRKNTGMTPSEYKRRCGAGQFGPTPQRREI